MMYECSLFANPEQLENKTVEKQVSQASIARMIGNK